MQDQLEEKKIKKTEFVFPFVGKQKWLFRLLQKRHNHNNWQTLVNIAVPSGYRMTRNIILFRKLATQYTTELSEEELHGKKQNIFRTINYNIQQH